MIDTLEQLRLREHAIAAAREISAHPSFPFGTELPMALIVIIERAITEWGKKNEARN